MYQKRDDSMHQKFQVTGMTCAACAARVEKAVSQVAGVEKVQVNLLSNSMTADFDPSQTSAEAITAAVAAAGYGAEADNEKSSASVKSKKTAAELAADELREMKTRLIISFLFFIPLFYISMGHMVGLPIPGILAGMENAVLYGFTQFLLCLPVIYVNRKYFQRGFKALWHRSPNMDSLIAIGSLAAVSYGVFAIYRMAYGMGHGDWAVVEKYHMDLYFESSSTILTLITLGKFLETRSKGRTGEAIARLMDLAPKTAAVIRDGVETVVPVEQVRPGDTLAVRPGQSIPVDGEILSGTTAVDESAITGESIPVEKAEGDKVIAATINKSGYFTFRAEKVGDDTTLSQIIRLVEEAGNSKAPIAKLADKISGVFVPTVIGIAVLAFVVWMLLGHSFEFALSIGIAVLVISCPCALGLATPVAIMVGTGKGAEYGVLFKSAEALEHAHTIQTVVLDKTGTITQGRPRVTDIVTAPGVEADSLLALAAALEHPSEHPLAEAVLEKARERGLSVEPVEDFRAVSGRGISASFHGTVCLAGNAAMMEENGVELGGLREAGDRLAQDGKTPLYFAIGKKAAGLIGAADVVKPTSRQAVQEFTKMGIEVVMLTGDNQRTAEAIRKQVGVSRAISDVLPQDKEREIRRLQEQGRRVAMIGDGINDAPALARSDVGIAIGAGTDVAMESADVVLMKSDLLDAVTAIQLSRSVIRNIRMNLFWAFFYNSVGIPLAAGVFYGILGWKLNPMFAAAAMSLSSVCVVTNALRIKLFRPNFTVEAAGDPVPTESHAVLPVSGQAVAGSKGEEHNRVEAAGDTVPAENHISLSASGTAETETKGEKYTMKKEIKIEGMMCQHCQMAVEKALSKVPGVSEVKVDLENKTAVVSLSGDVSDETLNSTVTEAGYEPKGIAVLG